MRTTTVFFYSFLRPSQIVCLIIFEERLLFYFPLWANLVFFLHTHTRARTHARMHAQPPSPTPRRSNGRPINFKWNFRSKIMQDRNSITVVRYELKILLLGITVRHHEAIPQASWCWTVTLVTELSVCTSQQFGPGSDKRDLRGYKSQN